MARRPERLLRMAAVSVALALGGGSLASCGSGHRAGARAGTTEEDAATVASGSGATGPADCFWRGPATGKGRTNAAFPDLGATYWTAVFRLPPGATLHLTGRFPHARYLSVNAYDIHGVATSVVTDVGIVPEPGSTNPFAPGADRTATQRSYRLDVDGTPPPPLPAAPATNTLYAGVGGQSGQILIYRVYVADRGAGVSGGVDLPAVSLRSADGTTSSGPTACRVVDASAALPASQALPLETYLPLRGSAPTAPATDPPVFWRAFSVNFLISCIYRGSCGGSPALTPGQYSNLDNAYAVAAVSRGFASGPVLVLRGRMPKTPHTTDGATTMPAAMDLRYWSMCQNESLATTRVGSCLDDEQVPLDAHRDYVIVSSTPADRPVNATASCGVAWLPWPTAGDGAGHRDDGLLILRNMLPGPAFASAVQDVARPGQERTVMGGYLPTGSYTTTTAFAAMGCHPVR